MGNMPGGGMMGNNMGGMGMANGGNMGGNMGAPFMGMGGPRPRMDRRGMPVEGAHSTHSVTAIQTS